MEKHENNMIDEINKRIEALKGKRDALIRKEKEKKAKAREKWKTAFYKGLIKEILAVFGPDYEESVSPEELAAFLSLHLPEMPGSGSRETKTLEIIPETGPGPAKELS